MKLPLFGELLSFARDPLGFLVELQSRGNRLSHQKALGQNFFVLFEPEDIEHVLVKNAKNYRKNKFLKAWDLFFGQGLITSDGETWKRDRKLIQPLFHRDRIQAYTAFMKAASEARFSRWSVGETKIANREMSSITLDMFLRTILGLESGDTREDKLAKAFDDCAKFFYFTANPLGIFLGSLPTGIKRNYENGIKTLHEVIDVLIAEKKVSQSSDLLSVLMNAKFEDGKVLTDQEMRDHIVSFIFAGHETTAITLAYAVQLISLHPEVQKKLREELTTHTNIDEQPYLKAIISEVLRMYPASWMVGRDAIAADSIGGVTVPKGSVVIMPTWAYHRDPKYYEDPMTFRPERWTPEFQKALPRTKFIPFGYGGRMCIGNVFALYELQYTIGSLYQRFGTELVSDAKFEIEPSITARPKKDIVFRLTT